MSCHDTQSALYDYIDNTLSESRHREVEDHLQTCSDCRRELSERKICLSMCQSLDEVEPPPFLTSRIMAEVRSLSEKKSWFSRFFMAPIQIPAGALATVCILLAMVSIYFVGPHFESPDGNRLVSDRTVPPAVLPDSLPKQTPLPSPNEHLAKYFLKDKTLSALPDVNITIRVEDVRSKINELLLKLLEMDAFIQKVSSDESAYRIVTEIETKYEQELLLFIKQIGETVKVTESLNSQKKSLVSITMQKTIMEK